MHGLHHRDEDGFPRSEDTELFERLVLVIDQAGLSWLTILKERDNFRSAYDGFDVDVVAAYADEDRTRLLQDAGIVRIRLEVDAVIHTMHAESPAFGMPSGRFRGGWTRTIRARRPVGCLSSGRSSGSPAERSPGNS